MSRASLKTFLCALSLALCGQALACGKGAECSSLGDWERFNSIALTLSTPGKPGMAIWNGRFDHEANDILIDAEVTTDPGRMKGSIALVGGRAMFTKDLELKRGYEIDALDGPVLGMQLVLRVLDRLFPKGPSSISKEERIDHADPVAIRIATPSAEWRISGTWRVTGKVATTAKGDVAYDLLLDFPAEAPGGRSERGKMHMSGELARVSAPVFRDDSSLEGWTAYGVGPHEEKAGDSTILDYGAKRHDRSGFHTVGEVRAYLADEFGPGKRDATKDFTGFWKGKCSEDFGLKILHTGDEGKYVVLFCGPGGCDDIKRARLTYITGDKGYTVVNDDEILSGRGEHKERYVRCSKEVGSIAPPR